MGTVLTVIHIILCISLAVTILAQPSKQGGLGAALGGASSGESDNFFKNNKGRTYEGKMEKLTIILGILVVISTIGLSWAANL